jgi:parallel beta-helix repeat protein
MMNRLLYTLLLLGTVTVAKEIKVKAPNSIQAAIDAAYEGDQITVAKGIYAEQLTISKHGIKLVGQNGAVLVAPASPITNGCSGLAGPGTQAGICVIGGDVQLGDMKGDEHLEFISVGTPIKNVLVKGFEVHGFTGLNIAVVGAKNAEVRENVVSDGTRYGILTLGSTGTLITRNTVANPGGSLNFIGICMDDKSDVSVTQNSISDFKIGLCVETHKANVGHNKVSQCCIGAFIDPGIEDAQVTHNTVVGTTRVDECINNVGAIVGIIAVGSIRTNIQHNHISGQPTTGAAIAIVNDAADCTVDFNTMSNNDLNVFISTSQKNEIKHNTCTNPSDFCNL